MFRLTTFKFNRDNLIQSLAAIFLLFSISTATLGQPQEASASNMQNCHYMDRVEGSSGYGKKSDWQSQAKYSVLAQAEELGASHIVWERFTPIGAFNGIAVAKAYNCNS
ncbi:hypothetical protein [Methylobacter sp.]|uniref:hypothetical protein n=1 Tax=Methylobacter sp. TaxID=2051955 RepID=UPI00120D1E79|nr:hypothetical protein [Methylobacter sp.]TAK63926.1 MAG: hypothetical protein EPO18_05150 [Methylobacter sp.]